MVYLCSSCNKEISYGLVINEKIVCEDCSRKNTCVACQNAIINGVLYDDHLICYRCNDKRMQCNKCNSALMIDGKCYNNRCGGYQCVSENCQKIIYDPYIQNGSVLCSTCFYKKEFISF